MIKYLLLFIIVAYFLKSKKQETLLTSGRHISECSVATRNRTSKCWIKNETYIEAEYIFKHRRIILEELINLLNSDKWSIWHNGYNETPSLITMKQDEILNKLNNNTSKIMSDSKPNWKVICLILNKEILDLAKYCPNTLNILLSSSTRILNAGFSLLEPGSEAGSHKDKNNKIHRLHIPLIIPSNNNVLTNTNIKYNKEDKLAVLKVENDYRAWHKDEYFIFDDTCEHNAWNNSDEIRIILLVDILKN